MKINTDLYIELLEAEVRRQRMENHALELRLRDRRPGASSGAAGIVGLSPSKAAEALAADPDANFVAPRNLTSEGDGDAS